jgi:hypothetical protein
MQGLILIAPLGFGLLLLVTGTLAMTERLPRNDWVGLRLHEVMRDDDAWRVGHKAGGPWLLAGGVVDTVGGAALLLRHDALDSTSAVSLPLVLLAVVAYTAASWRALQAVRRR